MVRNIANSLIQLHFHETASPEELMKYYGWEEAFEEKERAKLIEDTRVRLEAEQQILAFYQKEKLTLYKKYGTKNPTGDLGLPPKRPAGEDDQQGSLGEDARADDEGGPGPSAHSDAGPGHAPAEADHGADTHEGDAGGPSDGPAPAHDAGGDDRGGEDKAGGTVEILQHQVRWWLDGPGELDESDIEHLTKMITEGYSSGELNHGAEEIRGGWEIKS